MTAPTTIVAQGETRIIIIRHLAAAPALVFRAHVEPNLIRRWMVGPDGWTMPVCQTDSRPGGSFRFEWTDGKDIQFHATGEYLAVSPERIVHVERMFLPDRTPENHVETTFTADSSGTRLQVVMTLADAAARDAVLASGMADGYEDSLLRLETILNEPT